MDSFLKGVLHSKEFHFPVPVISHKKQDLCLWHNLTSSVIITDKLYWWCIPKNELKNKMGCILFCIVGPCQINLHGTNLTKQLFYCQPLPPCLRCQSIPHKTFCWAIRRAKVRFYWHWGDFITLCLSPTSRGKMTIGLLVWVCKFSGFALMTHWTDFIETFRK